MRIVVELSVLMSAILVANAASGIEITESILAGLAHRESARSATLSARESETGLSLARFQESYETKFSGAVGYGDTRRAAFVDFMPVFGPTAQVSAGLSKKLSYGLSTEIQSFYDQMSSTNDLIRRGTTLGLRAGLVLDLWQDFLGAMSREEMQALQSEESWAQVNRRYQMRAYELEVRKLYWSIMASLESLRISGELRKSAEIQLRDAEKRQRDSIATAAEVARLRALVSQREASITGFQFQYEKQVMVLREMLPTLQKNSLELVPVSFSDTVSQVVTCTQTILSEKSLPWNFTEVDEILELLEKTRNHQAEVTERSGLADLKLRTNLELTGVEQGEENAIKEFGEDPRFGYSVLLSVEVPLGKARDKRVQLEKKAQLENFIARRSELEAKVEARHLQIAPLINMLLNSVKVRQGSTAMLRQAISETERMYDQARVAIDALITDQNTLQSSLLDSVQIQLAVIHEILDYFSLFTQTPCAINQIVAVGAVDGSY